MKKPGKIAAVLDQPMKGKAEDGGSSPDMAELDEDMDDTVLADAGQAAVDAAQAGDGAAFASAIKDLIAVCKS